MKEQNRWKIVQLGGVTLIAGAMQRHSKAEEVLEQGCQALYMLAYHQDLELVVHLQLVERVARRDGVHRADHRRERQRLVEGELRELPRRRQRLTAPEEHHGHGERGDERARDGVPVVGLVVRNELV